uniref:Uncharacterized protein n=1 Tax=Anopheles farauti TaxID=69004 RepID=A0A182Q510_9DIPT
MLVQRAALTLPIVLALFVGSGWALPNRKVAEESDGAVSTKDHYDPQCLPLDFFEKEDDAKEGKSIRAKREEAEIVAAEEPKDEEQEIVAQPGYVVPAGRRRLCFGRRRNFTAGCGPPRSAYRVKNFVMGPNPAFQPIQRPGRARKIRPKPKD